MSRPKVIGGSYFVGNDSLSNPLLLDYVTTGHGPASASTLKALGWKGKVIGGIIFWLSLDNNSLSRGKFFTAGELLTSPYIVPAQKLWPSAPDNISLSLPLTSADIFEFPETLTSDYIENVNFAHSFVYNDARAITEVSDETLDEFNIGNFCLRAFASPMSSFYVRLHILLYPCSLADLSTHALHSNPKWPGIPIFNEQFAFFPTAGAKKLKYGCPLLPLLIPSPPGILPANGLSPSEFTAKIASLLRSSILPDTVRTGAALLLKWNKIDLEGIRALDDSLNPVIWPSPPTLACSPSLSGMSVVSPLFYYASLFS